jgi:hypothetical protein
MFCPGCGAGEQQAKAFCKRCGAWMPEVGSPGEGGPGADSPQQYLKVINIFSAGSGVFALAAAVAIYATNIGNPNAIWSAYFAGSLLVSIAGWQITNFVLGMKLARRLRLAREGRLRGQLAPESRNARARALPEADAAPFAGVRSVTERTTELLEPAAPRRGRDTRR